MKRACADTPFAPHGITSDDLKCIYRSNQLNVIDVCCMSRVCKYWNLVIKSDEFKEFFPETANLKNHYAFLRSRTFILFDHSTSMPAEFMGTAKKLIVEIAKEKLSKVENKNIDLFVGVYLGVFAQTNFIVNFKSTHAINDYLNNLDISKDTTFDSTDSKLLNILKKIPTHQMTTFNINNKLKLTKVNIEYDVHIITDMGISNTEETVNFIKTNFMTNKQYSKINFYQMGNSHEGMNFALKINDLKRDHEKLTLEKVKIQTN